MAGKGEWASVEEGVEGKWVRVVVGLGEECMKTVGRPFRFRVVNALHFKIRKICVRDT